MSRQETPHSPDGAKKGQHTIRGDETTVPQSFSESLSRPKTRTRTG